MLADELTPEEQELLKQGVEDDKAGIEPEPEPEPLFRDSEPEPEPDQETAREDDYKYKYENILSALKEERELRKRDRDRLDAITDRIMQAREKAELEKQPDAPDYETDPIGYLKWENDQLKQAVGRTQQLTQEQAEFITRQRQHEQIVSAYRQASEAYQRHVPDYQDAKYFLMQARDNELQLMGFADPASRAEILRNEEAAVIRQAFASNINPAEMIYNIAKHRGYAGKQAPGENPGNKPAPKSLSVVRGGTTKPATMQDKIDRILKMSDDDLMKVSDKDLETFLKKLT